MLTASSTGTRPDALLELGRRFAEAGDAESAGKAAELAGKLREGRIAVAFAGHFSAGKSSLVNALCGKPLLPTGPLPTSANLVRIAHGREEAAFVRDARGERRLSLDGLDEACRDGRTYPRIEILAPCGLLEGGLELIDTPGVDSTDDAHREATEASLYLADVVFFVTDYNHVLSETNLDFLRRLEERQKPYAVLVNQVDKHRSGEMPFSAYRRQVERALRDWHLVPFAVLYVSVKAPDHPLSEWDRLAGLLERLKAHAGALASCGAARSALDLIRQHADRRFLEQLGRVKEAFELDRMFFIVNAVDLAESEEELGQVLERVERELARHGIRNPRLFAVSSREALEAKRTGDRQRLERSGFAAFEAAFARFAEEELAGTLLEAARRELMRVRGKIRRLAEQKLADRHHRLERAADMERAVPGLLREWRAEAAARGLERIRRELAELTHHVKKRCQYRFGDMFAETFHPSVLRDDGRGAETALVSAYHELVQMASAYVTGEMLATGLRMEQWVVREASAWRREAAERLAGLYPEWTEGAWEPEPADMPGVEDGLDLPPVSAGQLVRRFKSARSFFEGGGRDAMRGWLESLILDAACRHADRAAAVFADAFAGRFERLMEAACAGLSEDVLRFARALADGGAGETAATDWRELSERFERLVEDPCFPHVAVTP